MSAALLGSRISLISKKNIRYEGILYSINEADATVALQNVKSYGTEGREKTEPTNEDGTVAAFVPPSDAVHPYLLFRGCDIKDLHVHEEAKDKKDDEPQRPPEDPAILSTEVPEEVKKQLAAEQEAAKKKKKQQQQQQQQQTKAGGEGKRSARGGRKAGGGGGGGGGNKPGAAVGTGQSLMNRKARGVVDGAGPEPYKDTNFDIQGNLEQFDKSDDEEYSSDEDDDVGAYEKDDFFDTISSDVTDRAEGKSTGLRGAAERKLNTETFGATSLDGGNRRRGGRRRGGRGYGGRGRGRGRGGRGGGRGGRSRRSGGGGSSNYEARGGAPAPTPNNRWTSVN